MSKKEKKAEEEQVPALSYIDPIKKKADRRNLQ